jgi:hypothetical protein
VGLLLAILSYLSYSSLIVTCRPSHRYGAAGEQLPHIYYRSMICSPCPWLLYVHTRSFLGASVDRSFTPEKYKAYRAEAKQIWHAGTCTYWKDLSLDFTWMQTQSLRTFPIGIILLSWLCSKLAICNRTWKIGRLITINGLQLSSQIRSARWGPRKGGRHSDITT